MFDVAERLLSRYGMSEYYGSEGFDDGLGCEWIMCLCVCVCWCVCVCSVEWVFCV